MHIDKSANFMKIRHNFFRLVISAQSIKIERKKIEVVKTWPKPKSIRDISVFRLSIIYKRFI